MTISPAWRVSEMDPRKTPLEDVGLWGLQPAIEILDIMGDILHYSSNDDKMMLLTNEVLAKVEDVREKLSAYNIYITQLKDRLRELAPDDPLLDGQQQNKETTDKEG